ncbi:MAG TPA: DUF3084 domain-containing protein [Fimbriimonas sp.]|nr:DUF3084 domain-containing protein [Fimbriimonas sp.]
MTPIVFLVLIVLVGGAIGYVCDGLGKKLGKKKLSVWGLRPRHTAALGTILAGMIVSLLTIGLVALSSKDVRDWITQGAQALTDLRRTRSELDHERQKLSDVQHESDRYRSQIDSLRGEIKKNDKKLVVQKKMLGDLTKRISQQNQRIASLIPKQRALEEKLRLTSNQIHAKDLQIQSQTRQMRVAEQQYQDNLKKFEKSQKDLQASRLSLQTVAQRLNEALKQANEIDQQNAELLKKQGELQASSARLEQEKTRLQGELSDLQNDLTSTNSELEKARADLQEAHTDYQVIKRDILIPSRTLPMIYRLGEEVARVSVPPNASRQQAEHCLMSLLSQSRAEAQLRGAHPHGSIAAATLNYPEGSTREQEEEAIISGIESKPYEQVLISKSYLNAFESEAMSLTVSADMNPMVFKQGDSVAELEVNGGASRREILEQVQQCVGAARTSALAHKMIPRPGAEAFGSISADDLWELIDKLKQTGRTVRLQAVAQTDTYAADPLRLDFRIR